MKVLECWMLINPVDLGENEEQDMQQFMLRYVQQGINLLYIEEMNT